jgi:class 3 adenylate cyclase
MTLTTQDLDELLDEIFEDLEDHAELVDERLEDISRGRTMPDLEDMRLYDAKKFRLGIVFIDINDFTDYTSDNPEKDVLFMLNVFIPKIMELVRDMDGAFEKNTGDGILAYFGAEDNDETIAETVLLYYALVQVLLHIGVNPLLERYDVEPISISAGAALGHTHISRIGIHSLNRRTAVSTTANVASKLTDIAGTNQYYVNQGIYEKSNKEDGFGGMLEEVGGLEGFRWGSDFKGWTSPSRYYEFPNIGLQAYEEAMS